MQEERDFENSPPSSSLTSILAVVGALAGLMILVCGGAAGYVALTTPARVEEKVADNQGQAHEPLEELHKKLAKRSGRVIPQTHDPKTVTRIAATIFKIDLPADFSPRDAERQNFVTRAVFSKPSESAALLKMALTEWPTPNVEALSSPNDPDVRQAMKAVEPDYGGRSETTLKATRQKGEVLQRELTVLGQQTVFTFIQGKRAVDNKPVWKIWGGFGTTNGLALMILLVPESEFDEQAVIRMIEGIRQADKMPPDSDETWPAEPATE